MDNITLTAAKRDVTGKKTNSLRREGLIPAVVYAADEESQNIQVNAREFTKVYQKAGHSTLVDITLGSQKFKAVINEVQFDPRTRMLTHVMLNKVDLKEEMTAEIPVELIGEAPAVKVEKGILVTPIDTIEIKCLPMDLPSQIEVDVSSLVAIGDSITIGDIKLPKGVKLVHDEDVEQVLVTATAPQKEEEEVTAEVSPDQIELSVEKGKKETDETPAS